MNFLTGYKTYIVAGVLLLICVLQLFGISIPGVPAISPGDAIGGILTAFGLTAARAGATHEAAKALVAANQTSATSIADAKSVLANTK